MHRNAAFGSLILSLAILAGCAAGQNFSMDAAARVKVGMTKHEVMALLGPPGHQTARVGDEVWTWAHVNLLSGQNKVATIIFVDGLVAPAPGSGKPVQ